MSTTKTYVGVAPLTMARTEAGGYVNIYATDPVPGGIKADDLERLLEEGFLAEVEVKTEATPAPDTAEAILAEVGDDKVKAVAAIEAEKAGKNRSTLLAKLQKIVEA